MLLLFQSRDREEAVARSGPTTITFASYGWHLHGNGSGSIDPTHNVHGTPILEGDSARAA
jgi:hypothetical protein